MKTDNRTINYLRISITDRCNFNCRYCVPKEPSLQVSHNEVATYEEILKLVDIAVELGITKVRITGGEPFVRKGILGFLERLCNIKELTDISITTNASLLTPEKLQRLWDMGIKRLNFSLDTLNKEKFEYITGRDQFDKVFDTIHAARKIGFSPIKINAVILNNINDDEIADLAAISIEHPFQIRFIEYMPMGNSNIDNSQQILTPYLKETIESTLGELIPVVKDLNDGPAKKYKLKNSKGEIGFITPVSEHFCADCNRLRLTAQGRLRPCLLDDYEKDILTPLRNGASKTELLTIMRDVIYGKPSSHHLDYENNKIISQMSSIGG
ncbi:MAG: GTP 3',8-cyclase MoaA [Desulfobacteraceae bacterium]|nr:GTP 3',8-cyclase MoaA [Desulfobacteraceae bacterium]